MLSLEDAVIHGINFAVADSVWMITLCGRHHTSIGWDRCSHWNGNSQKKASYGSFCSYGGLRRGFTPSVGVASAGKTPKLIQKQERMAEFYDRQAAITANHNKSKRPNDKSGMKSSSEMEDLTHKAEILDESQMKETTSEKWQRAKKLMGKSLHQFEGKKSENTNLKVQSVLKSLILKMGMQQSQEEPARNGSKDVESPPEAETLKETESRVRSSVQTGNNIETQTIDSSQKVFSAGNGRQGILKAIRKNPSFSENQPSGRVGEIFGALARARSIEEVEASMEGLEGKVTMSELKLILAELGKQKHWASALKIFEWMHEHAPYKPDETVYQLMLLLLAKARKTELAEQLLDRMKKEGMLPGLIEYTSLIAGYVKSGDLQQGLLVLDDMRKLGISPAVSTYNVLIDGCVRDLKGLEVARGLLERMKEDQIVANTLTYANLIMLYNRKGRYRVVVSTFLEVQGKGCHLDKPAGNAVLNSYSRLRDVNGMLEAYKWMSDQKVEQDTSTYNIIFHSLAHTGRTQDIPLYYSKMQKKSLIPDVATCSILISAYGKAKDWRAVDTLLHEMKDLAVRPDLTFFNTLITIYGKAGRWEDVELIIQFLKDMQRNGLTLNIVTYNSLLNVYGKEGRLNDVMKWFSEMKSKGVKADVKTYNALVTAYSRAHHFDGVEEVLEIFKKDGFQPDLTFYQSILFMLGRGGRYDDAWQIIADMREEGYLNSADVYNSLMAIYGRGSIYETRKLFEHMIKNDIQPNPSSFKAMIDVHGQKGLLEQCEKIFEESIGYVGKESLNLTSLLNVYCNLRCMEKAEYLLQGWEGKTTAQSLNSYNSLIRGYGRTGEWTKAEEVVKRMKLEKVEPNMHTYVFLLDVYTRVGEINKGEDLIAFFQKENLLGSIGVYNAFLHFYVQHNNVKDALAIYNDLRTKGPRPDHNTYAIVVCAYLEDGFLHENFVEFFQDMERARPIHKNGFFRAVLTMIPKCRKHEDAMMLFSALELLGCPSEILVLFECSNDQTSDDTSLFWERLGGILRLMDREGLNIDVQRGFHNVLIDALWSFGWEIKALKLINISVGMGIYGRICGWDSEEWCLDLHLASVGAALLSLFTWINCLREVVLEGLTLPNRIKIILAKDWQMRTGENRLTRQAVHSQLKDTRAPFFYAEDNCLLEADQHDVTIWLFKGNLSKLLFLTH